MNRIFMSILISFSILLASDISVKTEREILKETLTTNHIINESNIPSSIQLPKAERKQESSLVKKQLAEYKKSIDTKMNIVKKLVSANNKKKVMIVGLKKIIPLILCLIQQVLI